jgi:hypothetical protein
MINETASAFGINKLSILIAGFFGGVISLRFFEKLSTLEKCGIAIIGAVAANYLTPAVLAWFNLAAESYENGIAFVIGLFGMSVTAAVITTLRNTNWGNLITNWRGRSGE